MVSVQSVPDGYNEALAVAGTTVEFRPLLSRERQLLVARLRDLSPNDASRYLKDTARSRVVWGEIRFDELDPIQARAVIAKIAAKSGVKEAADVANLHAGVQIELKYPHLSKTTCDYCKAWWYDPMTGVTTEQDGCALQREPESELLCVIDRCPRGTPEKPNVLSGKNRWAWLHFQECEAVNEWPDDPIVRRNARVIRDAIQKAGHGPRPSKRIAAISR